MIHTFKKDGPWSIPDAPKETDISDLLNRGQQILLELDRQHQRLHDAIEDALKPEPQAWNGARVAKADYDQAYSEVVALSKRLNLILQNENPEPPENFVNIAVAVPSSLDMSSSTCVYVDGIRIKSTE